jgi:hypothetical protein
MAVEGSHDSNVYLSSGGGVIKKLKSITSIAFSQEVQEENVQVLGDDSGFKSIIGPTQTRVAVDKILNNEDFIRTLAGRSDISGQFEYGDNMMSFSSACINNFSVNATINELPQASFDLTIYGSLSGTSTSVSSTADSDNAAEEVKIEELTVTFDKNSTNSVQSFNFSEVFNKQAFYQIGQNEPSDIKTIGTIQQEVAINIEVEDYEIEETFSFLSGTKDRNRTIKLEIGSPVQNTYELQNASLVSENISLGAGGTPVASLIYRGHRPSVEPSVAFSFEIAVSNFLSFSSDVLALGANGVSNVTTRLRTTFGDEAPTIVPSINNFITTTPNGYVDKSDLLNDNYTNTLQTNISRSSAAGDLDLVLTKIAKVEGFAKTTDNFILNVSSLIQKTSTNDYNTTTWKLDTNSIMDVYTNRLVIMEDYPTNSFNFNGTTNQSTEVFSDVNEMKTTLRNGVTGVIPLYATNYQSSADFPGSDFGLGNDGASESTNNVGLIGTNNIECSANIRIKNPSLLNGKTLVIPPFSKSVAL